MPTVYRKMDKYKGKTLKLPAKENGKIVQPTHHIYEHLKQQGDKHIYLYIGSTGYRDIEEKEG